MSVAPAKPAEATDERQRSPLWVLLAAVLAAAVVLTVFVVNGQSQAGSSPRQTSITDLGVTVTMRVPHTTVEGGPPLPVTVTVDNPTGITWVDQPGVCQDEAFVPTLIGLTTPLRLPKAHHCARPARFPPGRTVAHLSAPTVDIEHHRVLPGATYILGLIDPGLGMALPRQIAVVVRSKAKRSPLVSPVTVGKLSTTLDLATGRVPSGGVLTGILTVANLSGRPLRSTNPHMCESDAYSLELSGPHRQVARVPFTTGPCPAPFAFSSGVVNEALTVRAVDATTGRPLPPGRYRARVRFNGFALPRPAPITVVVTPAASPAGPGVQGYPG